MKVHTENELKCLEFEVSGFGLSRNAKCISVFSFALWEIFLYPAEVFLGIACCVTPLYVQNIIEQRGFHAKLQRSKDAMSLITGCY
jgi:hypothetical protein